MKHIFLYGPPGSGKSTIGKELANSLAMRFIDLDEAVRCKAGISVPEMIAQRGEPAFREAEAEALAQSALGPQTVIVLGGGTLLRPENRARAENSGKVVCLNADWRTLLQRLQADPNPRPLLAGNLEDKLAELLAARAEHYASFATQLDANQPVPQLVEQLQVMIGRFHLRAMGEYDVLVDSGGLAALGDMLCSRGVTHPLVVTDENLSELHGERLLSVLRDAGYDARVLAISGGEASKTLATVAKLWDGFLQAGLDRQSTVVAFGGGVVGDLAGFAASTFMRGIHWVCVPTSLLAMVDAGIGGKTGFDLPEGKNLIGSFHAPRLVLADPELLGTLPEIEFRAGLAEILKHGVVADPRLFELCSQGFIPHSASLLEIVRRAVAVKIRIVEADPFEKNGRAALNFGHTVGHAVEVTSAFRVRHGEAVAMGMVTEARLSERLGIARSGLSQQIAGALSRLGLPIRIPPKLSRHELLCAMQNDKKKSNGVVRFALPVDIGRMQINVEVANLAAVFEEG